MFTKCMNFFDDKIFYKKFVTLALPIIIQNLILSSVNMVDILMMGLVGENQVVAVGIASQVFFLYNIILIGISTSSGMLVAQLWGAGEENRIKKVTGFSLILCVIIGFVFTLVAFFIPQQLLSIFDDNPEVLTLGGDYLRIVSLSYIITGITYVFASTQKSVNNTKAPMIASVIAISVNIVLNYILIFGYLGFPAMGVKGAAIGTVIARILEFIIILYFSLNKKSALKGSFRQYFSMSTKFIKDTFSSMYVVILNDLFWGLGCVLYTIAYGRIGTQALAATQISNVVINFFMVLSYSICGAALVIVGNEVGANNIKNAKNYTYKIVIITFISGLIVGVFVYFTSPFIFSILNVSDEAKMSAIAIMNVFAVVASIRFVNCVLIAGIFRGSGDAKFAFKLEAFSMWCVGVPLAFLGALFLKVPVEYVVALTMLEEIVKFIFNLIHLKRDKWIFSLLKD